MEKGGLTVALAETGLRSGDEVYASDEMRLGLRGMVRRVLAPKGVKVVQPLQLKYEWSYLFLAVNPQTGELRWRWIERMRQEHIKPVLSEWNLDGLVWDRAPSIRVCESTLGIVSTNRSPARGNGNTGSESENATSAGLSQRESSSITRPISAAPG